VNLNQNGPKLSRRYRKHPTAEAQAGRRPDQDRFAILRIML
jgi:hypothetical protein